MIICFLTPLLALCLLPTKDDKLDSLCRLMALSDGHFLLLASLMIASNQIFQKNLLMLQFPNSKISIWTLLPLCRMPMALKIFPCFIEPTPNRDRHASQISTPTSTFLQVAQTIGIDGFIQLPNNY